MFQLLPEPMIPIPLTTHMEKNHPHLPKDTIISSYCNPDTSNLKTSIGDNTFKWSQEVSAGKWTYTKVMRNNTFAAGEVADGNRPVVCTGAVKASKLQYISEFKIQEQ